MRTSKLFPSLLLLALSCALPALGQSSEDGEGAEGQVKSEATGEAERPAVNPLVGPGGGGGGGAPPNPLHMFASVTNSLGQGTFVTGYADNPMFATSVSLTPYLNWQGWWFMLNQSMNLEWTDSDTTASNQQVILNDTALLARYWGLAISEVGLRFPLTVRVNLPLSLASRYAGQVASVGGTAAFQWMTPINVMFTGNVNGMYNIIVPSFARRGATDDAKPYEDRFLGEQVPRGCLVRSAVETANFACGLIPRAANVGANVGFNWFALDGVMVSGSTGIMSNFAYHWSPDDAFTSANARPGLGSQQLTRGSLSIAYSPVPWLWLTLSADTMQPLFQANGRDLRWFPLWDIYSPANNFSVIGFDTTLVL